MNDYCTKICNSEDKNIFGDNCIEKCEENTRVLQEFYLDLKNKYKLNDDDLKYLYYCYNYCLQQKNDTNLNCFKDCQSNSELIKSNTLNDLLNKKIKVDNDDDKNNKQVNEFINSNLNLCEFIKNKVDIHNSDKNTQEIDKIVLEKRCPFAARNYVDSTMKNWVSIYCNYCKDEKKGGKPKPKSKSKSKTKKKKNYKKKTRNKRKTKNKRKGNKRRKTYKKKK